MSRVCLDTLAALFHGSSEPLGTFVEIAPEAMPADFRELLAHHQHMTVAMEARHRGPVDVRVLRSRRDGHKYAREILLTRRLDGQVVQHGIMRIDFAVLDEPVRREIEGESIPLGRILIDHNVLREVQLQSLWRIELGPRLAELFGDRPGDVTYGRTALIHCNGEPAVELLETARK